MGPDSLATATAVPFMSTFDTGSSPSGKHLGSSVGSYVVGDISRKGGFTAGTSGRFAEMWCPYMQHGTNWPAHCAKRCGCTLGRRHNSISKALLVF